MTDIEREISSVEGTWAQIDGFNAELKTFHAESWLLFRNSQIRFEEFLQKWVDVFKTSAENPLVINVLEDIRSYQVRPLRLNETR